MPYQLKLISYWYVVYFNIVPNPYLARYKKGENENTIITITEIIIALTNYNINNKMMKYNKHYNEGSLK